MVCPAEDGLGGQLPCQRAEKGVVPVENGQTCGGHGLENLAFGLQDALAAAQVLNVGIADVGDHRHVRRGQVHQVGDLSKVVHPHLQHADLVLAVQAEEGEGKAQLVVEVPLGFQHLVLLAQDGGHHVLGGGLAHAAGDADHRDGELGLVGLGRLADGGHGILHQEVALAGEGLLRGLLGEAGHSACLQGPWDELMPVGLFPRQGYEEVPRVDGPAVGLHPSDGLVRGDPLSQEGGAGGVGQLLYGHWFHGTVSPFSYLPPWRAFRDSSMMVWHRVS